MAAPFLLNQIPTPEFSNDTKTLKTIALFKIRQMLLKGWETMNYKSNFVSNYLNQFLIKSKLLGGKK